MRSGKNSDRSNMRNAAKEIHYIDSIDVIKNHERTKNISMKQCDVYHFLFDEKMENAHRSLNDCAYLYRILMHLYNYDVTVLYNALIKNRKSDSVIGKKLEIKLQCDSNSIKKEQICRSCGYPVKGNHTQKKNEKRVCVRLKRKVDDIEDFVFQQAKKSKTIDVESAEKTAAVNNIILVEDDDIILTEKISTTCTNRLFNDAILLMSQDELFLYVNNENDAKEIIVQHGSTEFSREFLKKHINENCLMHADILNCCLSIYNVSTSIDSSIYISDTTLFILLEHGKDRVSRRFNKQHIKRIIVPVHIPNVIGHFAAVLIDVTSLKIIYYDSKRDRHESSQKIIPYFLHYFASEYNNIFPKEGWTWSVANAPYQTELECGIFTYLFCEYLATCRDSDIKRINSETISAARKRILMTMVHNNVL